MNLNGLNEKEKILDKTGKVLETGKKIGKKVGKTVADIGGKAKEAHEKNREKAETRKKEERIKELGAIYSKDIKKKDFHLPNIIEIVDDAVRRDEMLCKGAIGWRQMVELPKDKNRKEEIKVEVLYIYDENVNDLNVTFVPVPECNAVYCVDPYDRSRYIRKEYIFGKSTEEKIAELEHIAYSLGAKRCSIEIVETSIDGSSKKTRANAEYSSVNVGSSGASAEGERTSQNSNRQGGKKETVFSGHSSPKNPELKWFSHDDNVKNLIAMRCADVDSVKSSRLELNGAMSATMSMKVACAIDIISKISSSLSMEVQAKKEQSSKLIFEVEF